MADTAFDSKCIPFRVCFRQEKCWDSDDPNGDTAATFIFAFTLLFLGSMMIALAELGPRFDWVYRPFAWLSDRLYADATYTSFKLEKEKQTKDHAFLVTERTEANFIRNNADENLVVPAPYGPEYKPNFSNNVIFPVTGFFFRNFGIFSATLTSILLGSLGLAIVSSAFSTMLYLFIRYEDQCSNNEDPSAFYTWVSDVGSAFSKILADFRFLPIFLIVGYIGYVVERWRNWMVNCHATQGRLHDVAMICGGCVSPNPSKQVRARLYKIYRYCNVIHAVCYKSASPILCSMDIETDFVNKLGLLTIDEAYGVTAAGSKAREHVLTWLMSETQALLRMEGVMHEYVGLEMTAAIRELRATCAEHHDIFVRDNPNIYLYLMLIIVNMMLALVIVGYPFALLVKTPYFFPLVTGFQPLVLIGVFVETLALRWSYSLLVRLRNPFSWTQDRIRLDSLLASTDRSMFIHFRAMFDAATSTPELFREGQDEPEEETPSTEFRRQKTRKSIARVAHSRSHSSLFRREGSEKLVGAASCRRRERFLSSESIRDF